MNLRTLAKQCREYIDFKLENRGTYTGLFSGIPDADIRLAARLKPNKIERLRNRLRNRGYVFNPSLLLWEPPTNKLD